MPGDYSRFRFNALRDRAGVYMQQGRVVLESDFNEYVDIADRRQRAEVLDIMGRARVSRMTPDAFLLTVRPDGSLAIGKGRMYVDGLLAENHGLPRSEAEFDDALEGIVFADQISLQEQPYPPGISELPTSGMYLVYLDVWRREVTRLESPDLVESAVGVDTSTRMQTVWQVRLLRLHDMPTASCSTPDADIPGWSQLISPSTGRLTTGTFEMPPAEDPCELPPTGGYRGLENQLYRVQIHDAGLLGDGGATFKWSRENASVEFIVTQIVSAKELELESLGRDAVLGLETGDWVEILDDGSEFSLAPGDMRRITAINDRRITLNGAVTSALLGPDFDEQHLRVRRWDQNKEVFRTGPNGTTAVWHDLNASTTGVIPVPQAGTKLLLEHGITVSFAVDPSTSGFKSGDYWLFAARTADASVELLQEAPPLGTHHHYARLGFWTVGGAGAGVTDCRQHWPDSATDAHDCSCTVCVTKESHDSGVLTIQKAVDQVRALGGGTVCIGRGMFRLDTPIKLSEAQGVRIKGQGLATVLSGEGIFVAQRCREVSIENLEMLCVGKLCAVNVQTAWGLSLNGLRIESKVLNAAAISLSGVLANVRICDNEIASPVGIRANDRQAESALPPLDAATGGSVLTGTVDIEKNVFVGTTHAISLAGDGCSLHETRIVGNRFTECSQCAIEAVGSADSSHSICGNTLRIQSAGIRCAGGVIRVSDNELVHTKPEDAVHRRLSGIEVTQPPGAAAVESCQLLANQVKGFFVGISFGSVAQMLVKLNTVSACRNGIQAIAGGRGCVSVENNQLFDIGQVDLQGDAAAESVFGIVVNGADSCTIAGNTIRDFGAARGANSRAAIATFAALRVQVSGNELLAIAPGELFGGTCIGIHILAPYDDFLISHNRVNRDAGKPGSPGADDWSALKVGARKPIVDGLGELQPTSFMVRVDPARVLVFAGDRPYVTDFAEANEAGGEPTLGRRACGSIVGNALNARGRSPAVDVTSVSECVFNDNRVELVSDSPQDAVVLATRGVAVASANRVRGGSASIRFHGPPITALGNITSAPIFVDNTALGSPWDALNVTNA